MTDPTPQPSAEDETPAELDVEGHSVSRMMGMGQLTKPGTPPSTGRAGEAERSDPDLPPLTRRFPSMRDGESRTPKR